MPGPRPFSFSVGERKIMNHFVVKDEVCKHGKKVDRTLRTPRLCGVAFSRGDCSGFTGLH
jgi:hypothetical protein